MQGIVFDFVYKGLTVFFFFAMLFGIIAIFRWRALVEISSGSVSSQHEAKNISKTAANDRKVIMIYRVARKVGDGIIPAATTSRPPGNVPYYVDNIWEWLRPQGAPSRRRAAFASPTPELAAAGAQGVVADAWRVELVDTQSAFQITKGERPHDAKYHADIARLKSLIIRDLRERSWFDLPLSQRKPELDLFAPCLSKSDMQEILGASTRLDAEKMKAACTFWQDAERFDPVHGPVHATGEIFFEGAYRLFRAK